MLILNTPHNPVGKVFTRAELEKIAELAKEYNFLVMSDEVVSPGRNELTHTFLLNLFECSMTVWSTMAESMFVSLLSLGCGNVPFLFILPAVRKSWPQSS